MRTIQPEDPGLATVRRLLLALVLFGSAGLLLELVLLEHFEDLWQWTPIVLLGAGLVAGVVLWIRPGPRVVRIFRWLMVAFLAASVLGVALHYRGNAEFEREMDRTVSGLTLVWYALRGATPALAPGALAQLGILGLILVYRHPFGRAYGIHHAQGEVPFEPPSSMRPRRNARISRTTLRVRYIRSASGAAIEGAS